jgi:sugar phosphate isomerase/epimerase
MPLAKALPAVRRMGLHGLEFDARGEMRPQDLGPTALRQLRKLLDDNELRVCAVEFHTRRGYGVMDELDRRVEATKAAMKMARALGCDLIVNQVGHIPEDLTKGEGQTLVEVLRDLGHFGQHTGAMLCAETGSETPADLKRLLDALPTGALAVTLDPGNLVMNGFSPREAVDVLGDAIRHVHAHDAARDLRQRRGIEVELGRGEVDFPNLLGALEEHDYRGWLSIERDDAEDPRMEIEAAAQYLAGL